MPLLTISKQLHVVLISIMESNRSITRKFRSFPIRISCHPEVKFKRKTPYFYFSVSVPETWTRFTEENIRRALSEMSQSDELLNVSNQLMAATNNDMWSQWNHVNVSLENRVQEEQVAKHKIQSHLEKVEGFSLI